MESELRKAAQAFVDKLTLVEPAINGAFAFKAIHGMPYDGPNYGGELAALKSALAPSPEPDHLDPLGTELWPDGLPNPIPKKYREDVIERAREAYTRAVDIRGNSYDGITAAAKVLTEGMVSLDAAEGAVAGELLYRRLKGVSSPYFIPEEVAASVRARLTGPQRDAAVEARYIVTAPVPPPYGSAWWDVADTRDVSMPNRPLATFARDLPGAEKMARELCERLNKAEKAGAK